MSSDDSEGARLLPATGAKNGPLVSKGARWQQYVGRLVVTIELGILFSVVGIQLFGNWDTWEYYNQAQLFTLHLLGVVVAISLEPVTPTASYLWGLLLYRCSVLLVDLLVLSRESRNVHNGHTSAGDWTKTFFVVALTACSMVRLARLLDIVYESERLKRDSRADAPVKLNAVRASFTRPSGTRSSGLV